VKKSFPIRSVLCATVAMFALNGAHAIATTVTVLASSNFDPPAYTAGITVGGQGVGEPGWAAPWQEIGGTGGRGLVVTSPANEGGGAVQLLADQEFGTSVEREWSAIDPIVRVDAYVYVTPGAAMDGQIVTATPASGEIDTRSAGEFEISGSGLINVYNPARGGLVSTGFHTLPNAWNEYSLIVNTNTDTYSFLFNNQPYNPPQPLGFRNSMFYVDGINLRAEGTLSSYIDDVTVTAVPEPSSVVLLLAASIAFGGWRFRQRLKQDQPLA
jgi:hypothetical protein